MHGDAYEYVRAHAPRKAVDVLDVGGRNINGGVRGLFAPKTWTVVDLVEAPDVDVVGDITTLGLDDIADVVLCLEVLEHAENWADIIGACVKACRPGGRVILTAAGPGRAPHSAIDGEHVRKGEHYANIDPGELASAVLDLTGVDVAVDELGDDVRITVDLPKASTPAEPAKKPSAAKKPARARKAPARRS